MFDGEQKGAKGKPKAKAGAGEEGAELTPEEQLKKANLRIEALERELGKKILLPCWVYCIWNLLCCGALCGAEPHTGIGGAVQRTDVTNRALQAHNEMRQRQAELLADFDKEKQDTFAITADMTRQYKMMQVCASSIQPRIHARWHDPAPPERGCARCVRSDGWSFRGTGGAAAADQHPREHHPRAEGPARARASGQRGPPQGQGPGCPLSFLHARGWGGVCWMEEEQAACVWRAAREAKSILCAAGPVLLSVEHAPNLCCCTHVCVYVCASVRRCER